MANKKNIKKPQQSHTPEGPAEEFINEYDAEVENLPGERKKTHSTSPGENRNKVQRRN